MRLRRPKKRRKIRIAKKKKRGRSRGEGRTLWCRPRLVNGPVCDLFEVSASGLARFERVNFGGELEVGDLLGELLGGSRQQAKGAVVARDRVRDIEQTASVHGVQRPHGEVVGRIATSGCSI